jgi:hypothetical protein
MPLLTMNTSAILARLGIQLRNTAPGDRTNDLPEVQPHPENKRDPCLSVKIDHESRPVELLQLCLEGCRI